MPKGFAHHDGHKNPAASAAVKTPVTVKATAVLDAHAQTDYLAATLRFSTIIFLVCAKTGHDAFPTLGRLQTWQQMN